MAELGLLVGESATRALYVRALHLAKSSFERPADTSDSINDLLSPLARDLGAREPADAKAAAAELLSAFVGLLVSLIGEPLTHRLQQTAWGIPPWPFLSKDHPG